MQRAVCCLQVPIGDEEKSLLESVPAKWEEFNVMLANVEQKLEAAKNNFRDTLSKMVDSFVAEASFTLPQHHVLSFVKMWILGVRR